MEIRKAGQVLFKVENVLTAKRICVINEEDS